MSDAPRWCTTGWHASHDWMLGRLFSPGPCDVCGERPTCGSIADEPVIQLCGCCAEDWRQWMFGHNHPPLLGAPAASDEFAAVMEVMAGGRHIHAGCVTMQGHWRAWERFVAFTARERLEQRREAA